MSSAVETYIREVQEMRHGTGELGRYTPLINLLNDVGRGLKARVRGEANLRDMGAGHPDLRLFTEQQAEEQQREAFEELLQRKSRARTTVVILLGLGIVLLGVVLFVAV